MERTRFLSLHTMFPSHHSAGGWEVSKGGTGEDLPVFRVTDPCAGQHGTSGHSGTAVLKGLLNLGFPGFFESTPARPSTTARVKPV